MAALTLDKVDKVYKTRKESVRAVKEVCLHATSGEIIGLLGSSGCGKTSTLRMIAGFESVTAGSIKLGERRINDVAPGKRGVAMAFEGYALYPPLTVYDNIAFALSGSRRSSRADTRKQVERVAELLAITDILERKPAGLSGGQAQRVSLCRALLRTPDIFLLDEPMSQLEPRLRAQLRSRVKEYLLHKNVTTVFVTHDQTEALALADRIAVMEAGVLQQYGSPFELESRPANLFVGSFIGEPPMNVLAARVVEAEDSIDLRVESDGEGEPFSFSLPPDWLTEPMRAALTEDRSLHLGIRAHRLEMCSAETDGALPVDVLSNQWLGDQCHLALTVAGQRLICVSEQRVDAPVGEHAHLRIPYESLHIFDGETTEALFHGRVEHGKSGTEARAA